MGDLSDRLELKYDYTYGFADGFQAGLKEATKWIPMAERPPEKRGRYLISHEEGHVFIDTWLGDDGWNIYAKVLAWMPPPEPYVEVRE